MDACQDYIDYCSRLGVNCRAGTSGAAARKLSPVSSKLPVPGSASETAPTLGFNLPPATGSSTSGFDFPNTQSKSNVFGSVPAFGTSFGTSLGGAFGAGSPVLSTGFGAKSVPSSGGFTFTHQPFPVPTANDVADTNGDADEEPDAQPQEPQVQVAGEDQVLLKLTATLYIMVDGKWNGSGTGVLTLRKAKGSQKAYVRVTTETGRVTLNATLLSGQPPKLMPKQPLRCMLSVFQDGAAKPVLFAFKTDDAVSEFIRCMSQHT